jgi:hypothetical protein
VIPERNGSELVVRPDERARWVKRYRESGVGLKRFAEQHGLRYSQLHYWIYGGQPRARRRTVVESASSPPVFREYLVPPKSEHEWAAEISLTDGTRLRVERGPDPLWVGVLLDQLRRPCSR